MLKKETNNKIKVLVAMSGGVDSSVAAALLKDQGYDVSGVFMHFWTEKMPLGCAVVENKCCGAEAEQDARAVALKLNIPFYIFHFEKEFKKFVVDHFINENAKGFTPNPCVMCNKYIKFEFLLNKALGMGFDFVATGHYAKIKMDKKGLYHFYSASDNQKDQSYFLYGISQKQLKHFLFPISNLKKEKVRKIAKKFALPTHSKAESFDLCFVGDNHEGFLRRNLKLIAGDIIDINGNVLGRHDGLPLYTIGQRRQIKLSGGPYYVIGFNYPKNQLIVSNILKDRNLYLNKMTVSSVSWVSGTTPLLPLKVRIRIRHRHALTSANILKQIDKDTYIVKFLKPQRAITPGQSAVFYKGKKLIGGGIIISSRDNFT